MGNFITNKSIICKIIATFLLVCMLCAAVCSCSAQVKEPILECRGEKIPLVMYEFLLSRMKGELSKNKYDVNPMSEFWSEKRGELTNEEYYNQVLVDGCKNYLAALILFKEEGLVLSNSVYAEIESEIADHMNSDYAGSEAKFEAILQKYGVKTIDELRQIYEIEAKYQAVLETIYGADGEQIGDMVKEEYYKENYYRFKQILVSDFYYEYQTDKQGNVIYFDNESGKPIYDTKNGEPSYDERDNWIKDEYGVTVYYNEDGKIIYDTEKGQPVVKTDGDGKAITHKYSESQMAEREAKMADMLESLKSGNISAFESNMSDWELYEGESEYYKDGYYLSDVESSGYEKYMLDILSELEKMEVGEIRVVESDYGHHVIMKYELDSGKYSDSGYAEWFASFESSLRSKLFLDKCEGFYSEIKVNDDVLSKAKSIKNLGTNYYY